MNVTYLKILLTSGTFVRRVGIRNCPTLMLVFLCSFATLFAWPTGCWGQVSLPNLLVIGQRWGGSQPLWQTNKVTVFPTQIAVDYTPRGTIYGLVCQYAWTTNIADDLKINIQNQMQLPPKIDNDKITVWRSESRKITVMLERDRSAGVVRVIVTSVDKAIRNEE